MLKTEERDIGPYGFRVTQLPGVKGRKVLVRLYKVLGPAVAMLIGDTEVSVVGGHAPTEDDIELSSVSAALSRLAVTIKEDDLEYLCDRMADCTQVNLKPGDDKWVPLNKPLQDIVWAGRYKELFLWLGFALEVNYGGFFDGVGGVTAFVSKLTQRSAPSASPNTSTGKSGESSPQSTSPSV